MNKHIYLSGLVIIFIMIFCCFSCKKYLDKKSDKKLTVPSSIDDLQALLDNTQIMNKKSPTFDIASADEYYVPESVYKTMSESQKKAYIWENFDYNYANDWAQLYDVVYYANVVLASLNTIDRVQANTIEWDNVKGSALVYRANSFLKGVWLFAKAYDKATSSADLGISLKTDPDFDAPVTRATVAESYSKIIEDLFEASNLLPDKPVHVMRPSKGAAYGLLARTYLSMGEYDSACKYADLVLKINGELLDYNTIDYNSNYPFRPFPNKEIIMNTQVGVTNYQVGINVRTDSILFASYSENDLRKLAYFRQQTGAQFKGTYVGNFSSLFTGLANDEMYLTRAECNARLGNTVEAITDLNTLLINRYLHDKTPVLNFSNSEDILAFILSERKKELLFRGLRWIDVKRLNKSGENINLSRTVDGVEYILKANDNRYALPLPSDIVNISGIPQNPR